MAKSYTGKGDDGSTGRFGGTRISKASPISYLNGALDEANSALGLARALETNANTREAIHWIQNTLFRIGADISTPLDHPRPRIERIGPEDLKELEEKIDALDAELPELHSFVIHDGTPTAATLHLARAIVRRAERVYRQVIEGGEQLNPELSPYLNRLSSYLFALARYANHTAGIAEEHPRYT